MSNAGIANKATVFARIAASPRLEDIAESLRWHRGLILGFVGLFVLAAVVLTLLVPKTYTASTRLAVETLGLDVRDATLTPRLRTIANTQMQLLVSESVLARAVERENLARDPEFTGTRGSDSASQQAKSPDESPSPDLKVRALNALRERVTYALMPETLAIYFSVTSANAEKSVRLVGAITESFLEHQTTGREQSSEQVLEALSQRLSGMHKRMQEAEDAVQRFKKKQGIAGADVGANIEQRVAELTYRLALARTRANEARARYEQAKAAVQSGAGEALPENAQPRTLVALRERYAEVKRTADSMASTHGPRHPDLAEIRAQAKSLLEQIHKELPHIAAVARQDYEQAKSAELDLGKELSRLQSRGGATDQSRIEFGKLQREAQASRAAYEALLSRVREIRGQPDTHGLRVTVISPPTVPSGADGPPPVLLLVIAATLGLSAGTGIALVRGHVSGVIYSPNSMMLRSGLRTAASLPLAAGSRKHGKRGVHPPLQLLSGVPFDTLRGLQARLRGHAGWPRPQTVLVLSAAGARDRVGVALNLAAAAETNGVRTLLVDFDRREALLSRALAGAIAAGLDAVLARRQPLAAAVHGLSGSTLTVLLNHRPDQESGFVPAEAIRQQLLAQATGFDLVVLDGCGMDEGGSMAALAAVASDILVVARAGLTRLDELERLRTALGTHAEKVVGAVFLSEPSGRDRRNAGLKAASSPLPVMYGHGPAFGQGQYRAVL